MLNLMNRIAAVGGLLMLTGAVAFAQSDMKVDVPFTFHTPTATMAPGKYTVTPVNVANAVPIYAIRNVETGAAVAVASATKIDRKAKERYTPSLQFKCAGEYCALSGIYNVGQALGDGLNVRMKSVPKDTAVAEIRIPAGN